MKCFRLVRSVLVVSLVCLAGTVRADLVPNGGFTTDVSGWIAQVWYHGLQPARIFIARWRVRQM